MSTRRKLLGSVPVHFGARDHLVWELNGFLEQYEKHNFLVDGAVVALQFYPTADPSHWPLLVVGVGGMMGHSQCEFSLGTF